MKKSGENLRSTCQANQYTQCESTGRIRGREREWDLSWRNNRKKALPKWGQKWTYKFKKLKNSNQDKFKKTHTKTHHYQINKNQRHHTQGNCHEVVSGSLNNNNKIMLGLEESGMIYLNSWKKKNYQSENCILKIVLQKWRRRAGDVTS
jgi:hypothetical protein